MTLRTPEPYLQLGAESPGGLMLPEAKPSPGTMYAPRGVALFAGEHGTGLVVADTGNHRVLIWHRLPESSHAPADVVLAQADFFTEGPNAAGRGAAGGLHLPCGLLVHEGRLYVCDAWNHRVLVWDQLPVVSDTAPDGVIGQADLAGHSKNRGGAISARGLDCPYGIGVLDGDLAITDTQNRRVLVFDGVPARDAAPRLVMGQPDFTCGEENRGSGPGPGSFRWPHALCQVGGVRVVADAGNHRLLGWSAGRALDADADLLVGQGAFDTAWEMPHVPQGPGRLRFPYGVVADAERVLVADTANNRVLGFRTGMPERGAAAAFVLGQLNFDKAGENRWDSILPDTFCWPYGLALFGDLVAVADSGNNRVTLWRFSAHNSP